MIWPQGATIPVSYTHLDVYKRQLYAYAYDYIGTTIDINMNLKIKHAVMHTLRPQDNNVATITFNIKGGDDDYGCFVFVTNVV